MLPQIDSLPGAEAEPPVDDWDGERGRSEGRLDMRWHVVRPFRGVRGDRIVLGDEPIQPRLEIALCGRIGIFLDGQARRRVLHENRAESIVQLGFFHRILNLPGDFVQPLASSSYADASCHSSIPVVWLGMFFINRFVSRSRESGAADENSPALIELE